MHRALAVLLLLCPVVAAAQNLPQMSYQGSLFENGVAVDEPSATVVFRLYDAASGGSLLWEETQAGVPVVEGRFAVVLGSVQPLDPLEFRRPVWLETEYTGVTLRPRAELTASPMAMGLVLPILQDAPVAGTGLLINNTTATSSGDGIKGETQASQGRGVIGQASSFVGENAGVLGISSSDEGKGVHGLASNSVPGSDTYGVYGEALSDRGRGVYGIAPEVGVEGHGTGAMGVGIRGTGSVHGIEGYSPSGPGMYGYAPVIGVSGYALDATGGTRGVSGTTDSDEGTGVYGEGPMTGVRGIATGADPGAAGVIGEGSVGVEARGEIGLLATSEFDEGYAIRARHEVELFEGGMGILATTNAAEGIAVYGHATAETGSATGVYGTTSAPGGFAGYFLGRVRIIGDLNVSGTKNFTIDHPLDPANRLLHHFAVESDEVLNVYSGVARTDDDGHAVVELPEWFEALNTDFRYQLTCIGEFAQAIVGDEIDGNRFTIRTDRPGVKVSWEVTGVRDDPAIHVGERRVEEWKAEHERGTYLAPAAYGLTEAAAMAPGARR